MYYPKDLLVIDIPLLYFYINLRSSIICCLFSENMYLSNSLLKSIFSISFAIVSELFCDEVLETFVILSVILLPIELPVTSILSSIH